MSYCWLAEKPELTRLHPLPGNPKIAANERRRASSDFPSLTGLCWRGTSANDSE